MTTEYLNFSKYHRVAVQYAEIFVVDRFCIRYSDLRSTKRTRNLVYARFATWLILSEIYGFKATMLSDIYQKNWNAIRSGIKRLKTEELDQEIIRQFKEMFPSIKWSGASKPTAELSPV